MRVEVSTRFCVRIGVRVRVCVQDDTGDAQYHADTPYHADKLLVGIRKIRLRRDTLLAGVQESKRF